MRVGFHCQFLSFGYVQEVLNLDLVMVPQNNSGKDAVYGDSFAIHQLRQKWAITLVSNYYYVTNSH